MAEWIIEIDKQRRMQITKCMLVRCKDCKHGIGDENAFVCRLKQLTAGVDWYCADGELKEGKQE